MQLLVFLLSNEVVFTLLYNYDEEMLSAFLLCRMKEECLQAELQLLQITIAIMCTMTSYHERQEWLNEHYHLLIVQQILFVCQACYTLLP